MCCFFFFFWLQLWLEFTKFNDQRKRYKYDLPESELIDLVEQVCIGDPAWKEYVQYFLTLEVFIFQVFRRLFSCSFQLRLADSSNEHVRSAKCA